MKHSIIFKILLMLGSIIVIVFSISNYLFFKNNAKLIEDIEKHHLTDLLNTLSSREINSLEVDKKKIKQKIYMIARHSSEYLQNFDTEGLRKVLESDIQEDGIMLIQIWDNDLDDVFLLSFIKNNKVVFEKNIPKEFEKFEKLKAPIKEMTMGNHNIIGEATIYYDNSHIVNKIALLKEKSKKDILLFNTQTDKKLDAFAQDSLIIYFISLLIVLMAMTLLLEKIINNPLKKLKSGLDDFFLAIQNKKNTVSEINIHSEDEFEEMAHSLNAGMKVSAKFIESIHQLNATLNIKTKKEKVLLDNASQGFLTFDEKFIIDNEYSIKCEEILGIDITNKDIFSILFLEDNKSIDDSKNILIDALSINNKIAQKSILTLLPHFIVLNDMHLKLEFRIIEDKKFMLIITNESEQKKLEAEVQKEQDILKMIVSVIKDSDIFYDLKKDFEYFMMNKDSYINYEKNSLDNLNSLYRLIHTFKGLFLQLFMYDTAKELHKIESQFSYFLNNSPDMTNKEISDFINGIDFKLFMNNDFNNMTKLLGKDFVDNHNSILVDGDIIKNIKDKYTSLLDNSQIKTKLSKELLNDIIKLLQKPLIKQLNSYPKLAMQLAQKLGKEIYEFEVIGDKDTVISEDFKPFIKSLVHIFRNSVDHGIETAEERMELEKDIIGTMTCSFELVKDNLQIIISDDGAGIDIEKIKTKMPKEVDVSKLSDDDVCLYIFQEYMSTKDKVTETSGRGIGMSVIKSEIEKLNGTIEIQSKINIGTTFIFNIPFKKDNPMMVNDEGMVLDSIRHETKVFLTKYMQIDYENIEAIQNNSNKLTLNDFNVVIYVRGTLDFALMMSYEESILKRISNTFLGGEKVEENEKEEIYDSTAKETANIIVGLSFAPCVDEGSVSKITPPVEVDDILIKKFENMKTFSEDLITKFGKMSISIIAYTKKEI